MIMLLTFAIVCVRQQTKMVSIVWPSMSRKLSISMSNSMYGFFFIFIFLQRSHLYMVTGDIQNPYISFLYENNNRTERGIKEWNEIEIES